MMATMFAELVAVAAYAAMLYYPGPVDKPHPLGLLSNTLFFVAILSGLLCLALTPLAYRIRRQKPPTMIIMAAVVAGALPLIVLVGRGLFRS